jgi:hypothetical protein
MKNFTLTVNSQHFHIEANSRRIAVEVLAERLCSNVHSIRRATGKENTFLVRRTKPAHMVVSRPLLITVTGGF